MPFVACPAILKGSALRLLGDCSHQCFRCYSLNRTTDRRPALARLGCFLCFVRSWTHRPRASLLNCLLCLILGSETSAFVRSLCLLFLSWWTLCFSTWTGSWQNPMILGLGDQLRPLAPRRHFCFLVISLDYWCLIPGQTGFHRKKPCHRLPCRRKWGASFNL
jgi:hypothetical protein